MDCLCGAPRSGFVTDNANGTQVCGSCGLVVESNLLTEEFQGAHVPSGGGGGGGKKWMPGGRSFTARTFGAGPSEGVIAKARTKMEDISITMELTSDLVESAMKVYNMAVQKHLLANRRMQLTSCACLYIASRMAGNTPLMLVDFSEVTAESPYAIGQIAEYVMKHLKMQLSTVDPSLYIHKYISVLGMRSKQTEVTQSAATLMARMNRDWISQGRKPAGVLAAAIYLAARLHGYSQIRLENVTRVLSITNNVAIKRLEEAKKLYSKIKKESVDSETAKTNALPASLLMQQRRDELLKSYLARRGKDTSAVESFVNAKESKIMLGKFSGVTRQRAATKLKYEKQMENKKKYRKKMKKNAKVAEKKEEMKQEKKIKRKQANKSKKRKRAKSVESSSSSPSDSVSVSSVSTSTVEEEGEWAEDIAHIDVDLATSSDSSYASYASTTDADADLPLAEFIKVRQQRAAREMEQQEEERRIDESKAPAEEDGPINDVANLNDVRFVDDDHLMQEPFQSGEEDEDILKNLLAMSNTDDITNLEDLEAQAGEYDPSKVVGSDLKAGDELLEATLNDEGIQALEREIGDAKAESDDELGLFDMEGVNAGVEEDVVRVNNIPPLYPTQMAAKEEFQEKKIEEAQDFDGLSDVSSVGLDDWVVEDESEFNLRRRMWLDLHSDWKNKLTASKNTAKSKAQRKSRQPRNSTLMPSTFDNGTDSWDTVEGAVTDAMLHKGRSAVKVDNLENIFDNLTSLVNTTGRREGMASVLDEAVGDIPAGEETGWVSDDETNPWDGFQ